MDRDWIIFSAVFLAIILGILGLTEVIGANKKRRLIMQKLNKIADQKEQKRPSALMWVGRWFDNTDKAKNLDIILRGANINLKASEYMGILFLLTFCVFFVVRLLLDIEFPWDLLLAVAIIRYSSRKFLKARQSKLVEDTNKQLPEVCRLLGSTVRAGLNIQQGVELVSKEIKPPAGEVFRVLANELKLGTSIDEAFKEMMAKIPSKELKLMCTTIIVQRRAGGNLGRVLDEMASTLEHRSRVNQELTGATAESKFVAMVLPFMPLFAAVMLNSAFPGFLRPLFTPLGFSLMAVVVALQILGFYLIHRLSNIKV